MLVVSGCGGGTSLRGEITLEGADELSHIPSSRVVVQLRDVSLADASSIEIASREYDNVTTLPLEYELEWDEPLSDRNEYSVGARFYDSDGALIFINDTTFTVEPGDRRVDFYVIPV
ncbi:MAG: YbaY family lipoprotein [Chloroflexi bacterium]|nr:YbaY family lipoprotein [Chloroflexota bacterium]